MNTPRTNAPQEPGRMISAPTLDGQWTVRVADDLRCGCGRAFQPHDADVIDGEVLVICAGCHRTKLSIERASRP